MKTSLIKVSALLLTAFVVLLPVVASAQYNTSTPSSCRVRAETGIEGCTAGAECMFDNPDTPCLICCTVGLVAYITDIIFVVVLILTVIFILLAAYNFVGSGGDPGKVGTARQMVIYAIVGMMVAVLAKAIPPMVRAFMVR